jgi:SAM-dependent methyltransferase
MRHMGARGARGAASTALERAQWNATAATLPTARPWATVAALVPFPDELAGLRVVDVGAGGSDAVATLLAARADAHAVDPRYGSLAALVRDAHAYFKAQERVGRLPQAGEDSAAAIAEQRRAFARCSASIQDRRTASRYHAAVASRLPFEDASQDLVYSVDCVTQYLDRDWATLEAAVREALRVLRPGGRLVLVPFRDEVFALGYHAFRQANQERLLAWLDAERLVWRLDDLSSGGLTRSSRLVVNAP